MGGWPPAKRRQRRRNLLLQFGPDGRLARISQGGWTIDYRAWTAEPALGIDLPTRLDANRGDARVKLVVDSWTEGAATP